MTMSRTAHRLMTVTASVAVMACLPGLTGIASAQGNDSNSDSTSTASQSVLTDAQAAAVENARTAYFAATASARATLKTVMDGIWTSVKAETTVQRDAATAADAAYHAAKDAGTDTTALKAAADAANEAYRLALTTAVAKYATVAATAKSVAQAANDAAAAAYTKAITDAFAGQPVPDGLLTVPRSSADHRGAGDCNGVFGGGHRMSALLGSGHDQREFGRSGGNGRHGGLAMNHGMGHGSNR